MVIEQQVNRTWTIPLNALCVSLVIVCLLSLINLGSSVAFNAIISLGVAALISSYIVSIFCLRLKRWRGEPLPPARWSMGKIASSVETIAILFLVVVWVFTFFPLTREITLETMNWSSVIFFSVVLISLVYYFAYARSIYTGPVALVRAVQ
jgi:choline transport protein